MHVHAPGMRVQHAPSRHAVDGHACAWHAQWHVRQCKCLHPCASVSCFASAFVSVCMHACVLMPVFACMRAHASVCMQAC
eukprot:364690-Chlamydomonas_euryale.AAC.12